ncbi:hypothetical protein BC827DRAFT_459558 [Russula dissimulans]|nr:hypothetical protein BC827DRAFT_459558 [Russula dissimulans]
MKIIKHPSALVHITPLAARYLALGIISSSCLPVFHSFLIYHNILCRHWGTPVCSVCLIFNVKFTCLLRRTQFPNIPYLLYACKV